MGPKQRTRFPMARIKKIMQLDEDVGKVAQATPILISKALEIFLQNILDKSIEETKKVNSTRLSSPILYMADLKRCIVGTEKFDFLRHLVTEVSDEVCTSDASYQSSKAETPKKRRTRRNSADTDSDCESSTKKSLVDPNCEESTKMFFTDQSKMSISSILD